MTCEYHLKVFSFLWSMTSRDSLCILREASNFCSSSSVSLCGAISSSISSWTSFRMFWMRSSLLLSCWSFESTSNLYHHKPVLSISLSFDRKYRPCSRVMICLLLCDRSRLRGPLDLLSILFRGDLESPRRICSSLYLHERGVTSSWGCRGCPRS